MRFKQRLKMAGIIWSLLCKSTVAQTGRGLSSAFKIAMVNKKNKKSRYYLSSEKMTMGSVVSQAIRTGTGACPYDGWRQDVRLATKGTKTQKGDGSSEGLCEGGWGFYGVIHSPKAIRTALDANLQKAMRSPFPCRHRRSLQ